MLSRSDLEAIRVIVREEVVRALRAGAVELPRSVEAETFEDREPENAGDGLSSEHREAIRESARTTLAFLTGTCSAKERDLAEARYRLGFDDSWRKRARKTLSLRDDAPLTLDDMVRAMRFWEEKREEQRTKRAARKRRP